MFDFLLLTFTSLWLSSYILNCVLRVIAKYFCCMERKIRVAEKFTSNDYDIRLFADKNLFRLTGIGNEPYSTGHDLRFPTNCLGEGKLITRCNRNSNSRHKPTRGSINQVYADPFKAFCKLN